MNIDYTLYAIVDKEVAQGRSLPRLAEQAIRGGAGIIQLRDKISASDEIYADALELKEVTQKYSVPLIINDRVDIALAAGADGVHLGQDDLPFEAARDIIGERMILGVSVHTLKEFSAGLACRPDYLGVGTIYPSPSKINLRRNGPEIIGQLRAQTTLPLVGIGGITVANLDPVIQAGADGVAVISGLFKSADVSSRARGFIKKIQQARESPVFRLAEIS